MSEIGLTRMVPRRWLLVWTMSMAMIVSLSLSCCNVCEIAVWLMLSGYSGWMGILVCAACAVSEW